MEEVLKEILEKLSNLERKTDTGFATINERIGMLDRGNKKELSELHSKIDSISEVVAKTMEDITELKSTVENNK